MVEARYLFSGPSPISPDYNTELSHLVGRVALLGPPHPKSHAHILTDMLSFAPQILSHLSHTKMEKGDKLFSLSRYRLVVSH